jgi:hypothetical protein
MALHQVSIEATAFIWDGLMMLAREGCAAWTLPAAWQVSQPTFHSDGFFVQMS